jgi:antitoxin component YwqK of YwqJK toxin-antitoxin module
MILRILSTIFKVSAQNDTIYLDEDKFVTTRVAAVYFKIAFDSLNRTFFKDGILHSIKVPRPDSSKEFTSYYHNGKIKENGIYTTRNYRMNSFSDSTGNLLVKDGNGIYVTYHSNGIKSTEGKMENGFAEGVWKTWHSNGIVENSGVYSSGNKQGEWVEYYPDQKVMRKELFENGNLEEGIYYPETGKPEYYYQISEDAMYKKGYEKLSRFIRKRVKLSHKLIASGVHGKCLVYFVVEKDGTLSNFRIAKSLHPDIDNQAIAALKETSGQWKPGKSRGKIVRMQMMLPVAYYPE